jgi:hypothetical protein
MEGGLSDKIDLAGIYVFSQSVARETRIIQIHILKNVNVMNVGIHVKLFAPGGLLGILGVPIPATLN